MTIGEILGGGQQNAVSGDFSAILGGRNNIVSGTDSSIVGGNGNNDSGLNNVHIAGSGIAAVNANALHVNGLWANGLPVWVAGPVPGGPGTVFVVPVGVVPPAGIAGALYIV